MRRPRGEPAELIVAALTLAEPDPLSIPDLLIHTGLSRGTLYDNVKTLCRAGRAETSRDGGKVTWVSLTE